MNVDLRMMAFAGDFRIATFVDQSYGDLRKVTFVWESQYADLHTIIHWLMLDFIDLGQRIPCQEALLP